jgi:hypothetical protein
MNVNLTLTKDYIKYDNFVVRINKPNSNPISPFPKGVKQKSDAGCQRSDICLLPSVFCLLSKGARYTIKHLLYPEFRTKYIWLSNKVFAKKRRKEGEK